MIDLTRSGVYVGHVSTGKGPADLDGDGDLEPDYQAAVWIGRHRLAVPSGFAWDQILDVNKKGWMLGFGYHVPSGIERSYIWRVGWPSVKLLDSPTGSDRTRARRINDHGEIIGHARGPEIAPAALYWSSYRSRVQSLPLGPGGLSAAAEGINNRGDIVGYVSDRDPDYGPDWYDFDTAVWRSPSASPKRLPDLGFDGEAHVINDRGDVLGTVMDATVGPQGVENWKYLAALWRRGRLQRLASPSGTHDPVMLGLSARGWAVGGAQRGDEPMPPFGDPPSNPLLSTDGRVLRILPDLTGDPDPARWNGLALSVDDRRNEVVGWASDGTYARAVVWRCASRLAVEVTTSAAGTGRGETRRMGPGSEAGDGVRLVRLLEQ